MLTHDKGKKIYIALNSPAYSFAEVNTILEIIDKYQMWKCDGFIASDIAIIEALKKRDYYIKLSTMAGAYNETIVSFYKKMGVGDIIFPRDVSLEAMRTIVCKYPDISFEAFLMRNGCRYSDSHCLSFHDRKYGAMCSWLDNSVCDIMQFRTQDFESMKEFHSNNHLFKYALLKQACGLCSIAELMDIGIRSVKIVGRAENKNSIIDDIKKVRTIIDNNGRIPPEYEMYTSCLYGLNCYY